MSAPGSLRSRPETLEQAVQWERTKRRYLRAGLCDKCAAQAAWATSAGRGRVVAIHPPCAGCVGTRGDAHVPDDETRFGGRP